MVGNPERMEHLERFGSRSLHMDIDNLALTEPHLPRAHTFDFSTELAHPVTPGAKDVFEEVIYYDS